MAIACFLSGSIDQESAADNGHPERQRPLAGRPMQDLLLELRFGPG